MHTDPIADLLTRILNAAKAQHETVTVPYSKIKGNILKIMKAHGFIENYSVEKEAVHQSIKITIRDDKRDISIKRISKPGQRIYMKKEELKPVKSGLGINIISTSKGLMTNSEARKQNLGGELICEIS